MLICYKNAVFCQGCCPKLLLLLRPVFLLCPMRRCVFMPEWHCVANHRRQNASMMFHTNVRGFVCQIALCAFPNELPAFRHVRINCLAVSGVSRYLNLLRPLCGLFLEVLLSSSQPPAQRRGISRKRNSLWEWLEIRSSWLVSFCKNRGAYFMQ